ncbi:MAG TPA: DUF1456 family protein [Geobacteraceae bacterium]|nr:DUF1456 family protein [Geobacteraceae bacterium]
MFPLFKDHPVTNNDILRRFRYALDISNPKMLEIFRLAGHELDQTALMALLKKEEDAGFLPCSNGLLEGFLDGLIILRRGPREGEPPEAARPDEQLTNNVILRKLRIALELRDDEMVSIMKLSGVTVSKSELGAFFRSKGHKNYKECGDQFLRSFLKGLTNRYRV